MRWWCAPRMRGQNRRPSIAKAAKLILCVTMGVGVVLVEFQVALVVQESVENERGIAVGALDRGAVERRVVVCDKSVDLSD